MVFLGGGGRRWCIFFFISKGTAHDFYLRMISIQYNDGDTHLYFLQNNIARLISYFRYIVVYVYAVKNNETNDVKYLNIEKVFVTNGEFLPVLQLDQNNRPAVDIDGKQIYLYKYLMHIT